MIGSIAAAILAGIVAGIVLGAFQRRQRDQRDREIAAFGERTGQAFLVLGGVAALALVLTGAPGPVTAHVLYAGFVLSAVVGGTARIVAYRRGLPW